MITRSAEPAVEWSQAAEQWRRSWQQFATRPYEDVRLREIADDAEVTPQTLHTTFGSKDQLLTAAFLAWGERVIAGRDAAPVGHVPEAIKVLFDHYEVHGPAVLRMLSQEERFPAVRQMTNAGRAYHRAWAARIFRPLLGGLRGRARQRRLAAIGGSAREPVMLSRTTLPEGSRLPGAGLWATTR